MKNGVFHCDNSYKVPNFQATGLSCKTNLPPFTTMRGAGFPQGVMVSEVIMSHVARHLGLPEDKVCVYDLFYNQTRYYSSLSLLLLFVSW